MDAFRAIFRPRQLTGDTLDPTGLSARRAPQQGYELIIDEQGAAGKLFIPALVNMGRQGIGKLAPQFGLNAAADDVVIENKAGIEGAAEHELTRCRQGVQLGTVGRLKADAGHQEAHHDRAIAQQDDMLVEQLRIGQPVPG